MARRQHNKLTGRYGSGAPLGSALARTAARFPLALRALTLPALTLHALTLVALMGCHVHLHYHPADLQFPTASDGAPTAESVPTSRSETAPTPPLADTRGSESELLSADEILDELIGAWPEDPPLAHTRGSEIPRGSEGGTL